MTMASNSLGFDHPNKKAKPPKGFDHSVFE